ncbi:MAG TPA: multicopper oxidase family protein [Candidatus Dormibacteraeota bacterium]|nr:multicopper oxidase family protein [Candidatus Dormibacteraeota bacterium]
MSIRYWSCVAALCFTVSGVAGDGQVPVPSPPDVRSQSRVAFFTLHAALSADGRDAFSYNGKSIAPVIRVFPGDTLKIDYVNDLPVHSTGSCAVSPCRDMTNLHFHGLEISPQAPQDNVIDMMAMPGDTLHYVVQIPPDHPPGLFWYHTHPHGESHRQALDGMSGAIVIEGMDRYVPELRNLREQVLLVRGDSIEHARDASVFLRRVEAQASSCGNKPDETDRIFSVNAEIRPTIGIYPGERQFWRIVNASADRYIDLQLDGEKFEVVALDGLPLAYHDPKNPIKIVEHALVPPAGRLEAVVTGPAANAHATLRTRCVNTGPDGDPDPAMVLADVRPPSSAPPVKQKINVDLRQPEYKQIDLRAFEASEPDFVMSFTEDKNGFYINNQKYEPESAPMTSARVGTYQHWRVLNKTAELHPMHIHQVHFLVYAENGVPLEHSVWLDTVNVPFGGSVDVIMDFTNPIIKGMSLFHCHILNHEDKGMMAKILFE